MVYVHGWNIKISKSCQKPQETSALQCSAIYRGELRNDNQSLISAWVTIKPGTTEDYGHQLNEMVNTLMICATKDISQTNKYRDYCSLALLSFYLHFFFALLIKSCSNTGCNTSLSFTFLDSTPLSSHCSWYFFYFSARGS